MELLTERFNKLIAGVLECFDRIVITGTLPNICYPQGMTAWLYAHNIRIFDYKTKVNELRQKLIENTQKIAAETDIEIEYIHKKKHRKESIVKKRLEERGDHPGLVHIISTLEGCFCYQPWHDKKTHRTFVKQKLSQCLHYYFYFIDDTLGLCYLRVPTYAPFRLQFYCNGHNWLASEMRRKGMGFSMLDNAFNAIHDFAAAQKLADKLNVKVLHRIPRTSSSTTSRSTNSRFRR